MPCTRSHIAKTIQTKYYKNKHSKLRMVLGGQFFRIFKIFWFGFAIFVLKHDVEAVFLFPYVPTASGNDAVGS